MDADRENVTEEKSFTKRLPTILLLLVFVLFISRMFTSNLVPVGEAAPKWRLPALDGKTLVSGEQYEGQIVILDFWSVTCPPCVRQSRVLSEAWRRFKPRGVTVVGIATGGESPAEIQRYAKEKGIDYPMVIDDGAVARDYKVSVLPTLYIVGHDGKVAAAHQGFWSQNALFREIGALLQ